MATNSRRTIRKELSTSGYEFPSGTTQLATGAGITDNPARVVGIDCVPYTGPGTYTFRQLARRNNAANPVDPTGNADATPLVVQTGDKLLFVAYAQTQDHVGVKCQARVSTSALVVPGPFLGPNSYQEFQAVCTGAATPGVIVAFLLHQPG